MERKGRNYHRCKARNSDQVQLLGGRTMRMGSGPQASAEAAANAVESKEGPKTAHPKGGGPGDRETSAFRSSHGRVPKRTQALMEFGAPCSPLGCLLAKLVPSAGTRHCPVATERHVPKFQGDCCFLPWVGPSALRLTWPAAGEVGPVGRGTPAFPVTDPIPAAGDTLLCLSPESGLHTFVTCRPPAQMSYPPAQLSA